MVKKRKLRAGELGKYFVIFILPALIIYLLFSITPFLYTIYYSFTDYTDMNPIKEKIKYENEDNESGYQKRV